MTCLLIHAVAEGVLREGPRTPVGRSRVVPAGAGDSPSGRRADAEGRPPSPRPLVEGATEVRDETDTHRAQREARTHAEVLMRTPQEALLMLIEVRKRLLPPLSVTEMCRFPHRTQGS